MKFYCVSNFKEVQNLVNKSGKTSGNPMWNKYILIVQLSNNNSISLVLKLSNIIWYIQ